MKKTLLISILILTSFFFIIPAFAQNTEVRLLEPTVLGGAGDQASPPFTDYISKIFTQILIVAAVLAVLMIVIGGLQYITSFSVGSKEDGKKRMTQAVIGLILAIAAWLILNTISGSLTDVNVSLQNVPAPPLYAGPQYGPNGNPNNYGKCEELGFTDCRWVMACSTEEEPVADRACPYPGENPLPAGTRCCAKEIPITEQTHYLRAVRDGKPCYVRSYPTPGTCNTAKEEGLGDLCIPASNFSEMNPPLQSCGSLQASGDWNYSTGIKDQLDDASSELLGLISCLAANLDESKYRISSISDNRHRGSAMRACVPRDCPGSCAHSCGSCHYGQGTGKSFAIDVVPQTRELGDQMVATAKEKCGVQQNDSRWQVAGHYDHLHLSTPSCTGN